MRGQSLTVVAVCVVLALVGLSGCSSSSSSSDSSKGGGMMGGGSTSGATAAGSGGGMTGGSGSSSYASAGESIFLSGVGQDGQAIPHSASRVAQGSLMMGGGGCSSCHGADGRGGTIAMMSGPAIDAPDIIFDALIKEGFTVVTMGRAVRDGFDESGKPLAVAMPRWQMSDPDLAATIAYLKDLSAH
jgi:mono/diheme cytochrome c family protein